ncbi:hypothetical protein D3C77_625380 [compost metagenome]
MHRVMLLHQFFHSLSESIFALNTNRDILLGYTKISNITMTLGKYIFTKLISSIVIIMNQAV